MQTISFCPIVIHIKKFRLLPDSDVEKLYQHKKECFFRIFKHWQEGWKNGV